MDVWAIVLAAGEGTRFGGAKQFSALDGVRLVDRAVQTATSVCGAVVVVLPPDVDWDGPPVAAAVEGGATRSDSVRRGLGAIPTGVEVVVVHDAAHPLASRELFEAVIVAVRTGAKGAVPGLPITETVKRVSEGLVAHTLDRGGLVLAQTPHAFKADALRAAHAGHGQAADDSVLVEALGEAIAVVAGDPRNIHVTTTEELEMAARLLAGET